MEEDKPLDLNRFGFAPGMYTITCVSCGDQPWFCDKRAIRCEPCAKKLSSIAAAGKTDTNTAYCWYELYKILQQPVPEHSELNNIKEALEYFWKAFD
jgi:hypothetical protein